MAGLIDMQNEDPPKAEIKMMNGELGDKVYFA